MPKFTPDIETVEFVIRELRDRFALSAASRYPTEEGRLTAKLCFEFTVVSFLLHIQHNTEPK